MPTYKITFGDRVLYHNTLDNFLSYESISILELYPIGTLYKSINNDFDPNITFGGTWIATNFEGRTPVGFFDSNSITGGEETHTLTLDECPSHNHSFNRVLYSTYNNDKQNSNWNSFRGTNGTLDKVANGYFEPSNSTNLAVHNNIQKSLICKIWERIA